MNRLFYIFIMIGACLSVSSQPGLTYPRISLLTVEPGSVFYELEGHTGMRLMLGDEDIVINWGVFDFDSPNFLYRFVSGETDYMCVAQNTDRFINGYRFFNPGRGISEQVIPLDSVQSVSVAAAVSNHLRPENRVYRYNYVKDNCSIRPLMIVKEAYGDSLLKGGIPFPFKKGDSFRDVMRYYHKNYYWYQFGIDLALGSGIDYPLAAEEYAFAPVLLQKMLPYPKIELISGQDVTLPPTHFWISPLFIFSLFAVCIILGILLAKNNVKCVKVFFTIWFSILTLGGCIIAFLIFVSTHEATSPNFNLLWINPLCVLGIFSVYLKKIKNIWIWYHFANFVAVLTYSIIWICGVQIGNVAFIPVLITDVFLSVYYIKKYR